MTNHYDYIVIGAGPAGLQLGYYLQKMGCSYIILEREDKAGAFFEQFRGYNKGELRSEQHLIEDFASEWKEEVHIVPLENYFRQEVEHSQAAEKLNFVRS